MVQNVSAIVLAGGESSRMGAPKAALDWHGSTLLRRVTGILARSVAPGPVVVVSAAGQDLPPVAPGVELVADAHPGRGPLEGLAAGLAAVEDRATLAYVSSVDVPLLHTAFVRTVLGSVTPGVDAAVPDLDGRLQPLAAAYRVPVRGIVEELLAEGRLALGALLDRCTVRRLARAELPAPYSVLNLNDRSDYERALALRAPGIQVDDSVVPAWTLGDVLRDRDTAAASVRLNGEPVDLDPELPLVAGDAVTF